MTTALAANDLILVHNNQPVTTSLKVAEAFSRNHRDVLRKIQHLDCSNDFTSAHFCAHEEVIQAGSVKRKSKVYEMTKDGFIFLVMSFTGKKAAQIKEAYIRAFNEMAEKLYGKRTTPSKAKPKTLPNGLTLEQQEVIKSLVLERVNAVPPERKAKVAVMCWSSLKSKFGCTYKAIAPERFPEAVSLVARLDLDGEYLPTGGGGEGGLYLSRYEAHHLYLLLQRFEILAEDREKLLVAAQALESKRLMGLFDQIAEGKSSFTCLNRRSDELFEMYQRPGVSAGGGSLSA